MDFYKILQKFNDIDPVKTESKSVATEPTVAKKVALAEDAQLRVLAGVSTILEEGRRISDRQDVAEAKKKNEYAIGMAAAKKEAGMGDKPATGLPKKVVKKGHEIAKAIKRDESVEVEGEQLDEMFNDEDPVGTKKKTSSGTATKTDKGLKHERKYGKDTDEEEEDDDKPAKKKTKESFRSKFEAMVEAKKDDADMKVGDKKKSSTGGTIEKTKTGVKHTAGKNYSGKAAEKEVKEGAKPDFLDIDKDGDKKEPMKKAAAEKGGDKKDGKKGMSAKQEKYFGKKNESTQVTKKVVAESVQQKYTFKQCLQLVKESGGQQQIDPVDTALWKWAQRVAVSKVQEGAAREAMAAFVYERMGGEFTLYDVLSETIRELAGNTRPVQENDQEGPADLLAAVEEEMNNPGRTVDNLRDVLNATFGSDRSPEFKKARAVIGKYLDLIDNAEVGSEEDGIAPMRGGNIVRHIREYDLTDRLAHAAAMLDKVK